MVDIPSLTSRVSILYSIRRLLGTAPEASQKLVAMPLVQHLRQPGPGDSDTVERHPS